MGLCLAVLLHGSALAQTPSGAEPDARSAPGATLLGDGGLWFVATAELLPAGIVDAGVSGAREARDWGAASASYGGASLARGLANRADVFGAWQTTTAIGGRRGAGDVILGAKIGLLSERRGAPLALAIRGVLKLPTGNDAVVGPERADALTELVVTRRLGFAEITGSSGLVVRGDPQGSGKPNGLRSGLGVAVAAQRTVRVFAEVQGEAYKGAGGARLASAFDTPPTAAAGLTWAFTGSLSASVGINRALGGQADARRVGAAVRLGYRSGSRRPTPTSSTPAAPTFTPAPPPPPTPAAPLATGGSLPRAAIALEDVHFDFDRDTLRPDALRLLDTAFTVLRDDPSLRLQIDGHTCELGTAEYNLALGERRAAAVRNYLISRGIAGDRLQTTSFGKERPKHDNSVESTRALNRRAEMRPLPAMSSSR